MELVLFGVELGKEAADAGEGSLAVLDELLLILGQVVPGLIERDVCGACEALQLAVHGPVLARGPGCDGVAVEGLRLVRDDEVRIKVDGVAETLAARAGAKGIVKGKEARLRFTVRTMTGGAFEGRREAVSRALLGLLPWESQELDLTGLAIAGLDRVNETRADLRRKRQTINEYEDRSIEVEFEKAFGCGELDDVAEGSIGRCLVEPVEATATQLAETRSQGVRQVEGWGRIRLGLLCAFDGSLGRRGLGGRSVCGRGLQGLKFDLGALNGEERINAS